MKDWTVPFFFVLGAAGLAALYFFSPFEAGIFPACPVNRLTGTYCPGCGTCRAIHSMLHGEFVQAARLNIMTVALLPVVLYGLVFEAVFRLTGKRLHKVILPAWVIWCLFGLIIGYWVLRNIPYYPFCLLAPH